MNINTSKTFLKGHPRAGQPTGFKDAVMNESKKHSIRNNPDYWEKICTAFKHTLNVVEWTGKPYRSKIEKYKEVILWNTHGLSLDDFNAWFKNVPDLKPMVIIFFGHYMYIKKESSSEIIEQIPF